MATPTKVIVTLRGHFENIDEAVKALTSLPAEAIRAEIQGESRRFEIPSEEGNTQYLFLTKSEVPLEEGDEMGRCGN